MTLKGEKLYGPAVVQTRIRGHHAQLVDLGTEKVVCPEARGIQSYRQ